jgi:hypothetical protein
MGNDSYDLVFVITSQLTTDAIIRANILNYYEVILDFKKETPNS